MNIKKYLTKWLLRKEEVCLTVAEPSNEPNHNKFITFKLWFGQGGNVIQTQRYDHHKDEMHTNMYIIHDTQNIGDEINKIILKESLYS